MPISISRAVPKGNAAFVKSLRADRLITSRAFGPITHEHRFGRGHVGDDDEVVRSEMPAQPGEVALQRRAGNDRRKAVSERRVTVRSLSMPPRR